MKITVLAEEQRSSANMSLRDSLLSTAAMYETCDYGLCRFIANFEFLASFCENFREPWPPNDGSLSLRVVLKRTGGCGDISLPQHKYKDHSHRLHTVFSTSIRALQQGKCNRIWTLPDVRPGGELR